MYSFITIITLGVIVTGFVIYTFLRSTDISWNISTDTDLHTRIVRKLSKLLKIKLTSLTQKNKMDYITQRNLEYKQNIDEFDVGEIVIDKSTGQDVVILSKTDSSLQLSKTKNKKFYVVEHICSRCGVKSILEKDKKFKCSKCSTKTSAENIIYTGIDCIQYESIGDFNKKYKKNE